MGAIASNATEAELEALSDFAVLIGIAYQLRDDLFDQEEDKQKDDNKIVYQKRLKALAREAKSVLISRFEQNQAQTCLLEFTDYIGKAA